MLKKLYVLSNIWKQIENWRLEPYTDYFGFHKHGYPRESIIIKEQRFQRLWHFPLVFPSARLVLLSMFTEQKKKLQESLPRTYCMWLGTYQVQKNSNFWELTLKRPWLDTVFLHNIVAERSNSSRMMQHILISFLFPLSSIFEALIRNNS